MCSIFTFLSDVGHITHTCTQQQQGPDEIHHQTKIIEVL